MKRRLDPAQFERNLTASEGSLIDAVRTADVLPAMNAAMTFKEKDHAVVFSNRDFTEVLTRTVAKAVELARAECVKAALAESFKRAEEAREFAMNDMDERNELDRNTDR